MTFIPRTCRGAIALAGILVLVSVVAGAPRARAAAYQGYTLYSTNNTNRVYLINGAGTAVRTWTCSRSGGYASYMLEDGSILRTAMAGTALNGGGAQGAIQRYSAAGVLLWDWTYATATYRSHHDIEPLPNGNVLLIAWETKTAAQAVAAGLDVSLAMWPDHIVEVQPTGATTGAIVWQWHAWDHLIQDHDAAQANYGVVADHPELLDINMGTIVGGLGGGDWMHVNSLSYNPELDQIAFTSHTLDEVYVIDHGTTTAEAAAHSGGRYGKGGDILYRWGCPSNYRASGAQVFDVVHCAWWVPAGMPGAGHLMAYNNRESVGTSMVVELDLPSDGAGNYTRTPGAAYGPPGAIWSFTASWFFSNHLGGCQRLPNGNTLVVESTTAHLAQVDAAGVVQWEVQTTGEIPRALVYGMDYPGLMAYGLSAVDDAAGAVPAQSRLAGVAPNPFNPRTTIRYELAAAGPARVALYDARGCRLRVLADGEQTAGAHELVLEAEGLASGVYFCRLEAGGVIDTRKIVLDR